MKRKFAVFFAFVHLLWLLAFIPAVLSPYIPASTWWIPNLFGLVFPLLWLGGIVLILISFRVKNKFRWVGLICLLTSVPAMLNTYIINYNALPFTQVKKTNSLRVMQFNSQGISGFDIRNNYKKIERNQFKAFVLKYAPDIIMLQEMAEVPGESFSSNEALIRDSLGFKYTVFKPFYKDYQQWGTMSSGLLIGSKYPIAGSHQIAFPGKKIPEHIMYADVQTDNGIIRLATTHLQSMHLNQQHSQEPVNPWVRQDSAVIMSDSKLKKFQYFFPYQAVQAQTVRQFIDTCTTPLIMGADLNSLPTSYVYTHIKGNLQDAFKSVGSGFGKTFDTKQPHIRIDYLFASQHFKVLQAAVFSLSISDHKTIIADFDAIVQ